MVAKVDRSRRGKGVLTNYAVIPVSVDKPVDISGILVRKIPMGEHALPLTWGNSHPRTEYEIDKKFIRKKKR